MNRWILPIMGFTESPLNPTGIEKVWRSLREHSSADLCVMTPCPWGEDMQALATFITRNSAARPLVMVIAYSWGAGWGAIRFANEAWQLGIEIEVAVFCDPVYRSTLLPSVLPLNPLSMMPVFRPRIEIPPSVRRVRWVRQIQDYPRGHDLVAANPDRTEIDPPQFLPVGHSLIDDSAEFAALVHESAREFLTQPV